MCLCTIKWIIIWKKKPSVFFGLYGREMLLVTLNTELTAIHTEHCFRRSRHTFFKSSTSLTCVFRMLYTVRNATKDTSEAVNTHPSSACLHRKTLKMHCSRIKKLCIAACLWLNCFWSTAHILCILAMHSWNIIHRIVFSVYKVLLINGKGKVLKLKQ